MCLRRLFPEAVRKLSRKPHFPEVFRKFSGSFPGSRIFRYTFAQSILKPSYIYIYIIDIHDTHTYWVQFRIARDLILPSWRVWRPGSSRSGPFAAHDPRPRARPPRRRQARPADPTGRGRLSFGPPNSQPSQCHAKQFGASRAILQPAIHKSRSFGSSFLGSCLHLGGFHPLKMRS